MKEVKQKMRILRRNRLFYVMIMVAFLAMFTMITDADAYKSITSRENGVTVDVKPLEFISGQPAKFKVRINTHSVELDADMTAVSTLSDDQGREYMPVKWDGAGPGGHHRSGILEFPTLEGRPKSVTLVIRNIANVPERVFQWNLGD
jgi:hypothetical protein